MTNTLYGRPPIRTKTSASAAAAVAMSPPDALAGTLKSLCERFESENAYLQEDNLLLKKYLLEACQALATFGTKIPQQWMDKL